MKMLRMTDAELAKVRAKWADSASQPYQPLKMGPKPSKMRNIVTEVDGITWHSKKEADRYRQLKIMALAGEIKSLRWHHCYPLKVNGELICEYFCDFDYFDKDGKHHVIDVKGRQSGPAWDMFRIKAKLMKALYNIEVEVE